MKCVAQFIVAMLVVGTAQAASIEDPEIVVENGIPVLRLPDSLIALIDTTFPSFRVPDNTDLTGSWATWIELETVPYAVVGDFNGDGLTDVALILVNDTAFRQAIFLKEAGSYVLALDEGNTFDPPGGQLGRLQSIYLRLLPQGQEEVYAGPTEEDTVRFTPEFDSIELGIFESSEGEIAFWKDGAIDFQPLGGL